MRHILPALALAALAVASVGPATAQPGGSYEDSCQNIRQRGPFLMAECQTERGDWRPSRLDLADCNRGDISNQNGRLVCSGGGRGYGAYARYPRRW